MGEQSKIEWTDATFNPWWGCAKVSPGCDNCYAERDATRWAPARGVRLWGVDASRRTFGDSHWQEPLHWARKLPKKLGRRPRVFCASMADVFDKNAPAGARERLWGLIDSTPELDWLVLTKRIGNASTMMTPWYESGENPRGALPPNVWLGISVVNQAEADRDIPKLLALPARVKFLSIEPMLGPVNFRWAPYAHEAGGESYRAYLERAGSVNEYEALRKLDWVIVGGESGRHARPMAPSWARSVRDQCAAADVPFFFKQWGEWKPCPFDGEHAPAEHIFEDGTAVMRVGKKSAGRELDGALHGEFPQ